MVIMVVHTGMVDIIINMDIGKTIITGTVITDTDTMVITVIISMEVGTTGTVESMVVIIITISMVTTEVTMDIMDTKVIGTITEVVDMKKSGTGTAAMDTKNIGEITEVIIISITMVIMAIGGVIIIMVDMDITGMVIMEITVNGITEAGKIIMVITAIMDINTDTGSMDIITVVVTMVKY